MSDSVDVRHEETVRGQQDETRQQRRWKQLDASPGPTPHGPKDETHSDEDSSMSVLYGVLFVPMIT